MEMGNEQTVETETQLFDSLIIAVQTFSNQGVEKELEVDELEHLLMLSFRQLKVVRSAIRAIRISAQLPAA